MSNNPYDAFRRVINHEANQHDDGGFFAKLGGLEPDPDDDGPTAKGLFQPMDFQRYGPVPMGHLFHDNGGKLPIGPQWKEWVKEHQEILRKINRNPRYLQPIVKVRSDEWGDAEGVYTVWLWECQICVKMGWTPNWRSTQQLATHHAHNHHRSQK